MSDFKESKDNPLYKEFSLWANLKYVFNKIAKYCPVVFVMSILGIVCNSVVGYYWGIVGKYIIEVLEMEASLSEKVNQLFFVIGIATAIMIVICIGSTIPNTKMFYHLIYVRTKVITEKTAKVLGLPYEYLEKPEVLDIFQRAGEAVGGNENGFEGMMNNFQRTAQQFVTLVVCFIAVSILDIKLIVVLLVLGIFQYWFFVRTSKKDKTEVWDNFGPIWRKNNYLSRITTNFEFAKDIRLFAMNDFIIGKQLEACRENQKTQDYHCDIWFVNDIISQFISVIGRGLIFLTLIYSVINKGLSIADFTMYLAFASSFSSSLENFLRSLGSLQKASIETNDLRSFMEIKTDENNTKSLPNLDSIEFEFHNVSYKYSKSEKYALHNMNLTIHPGEKLAVVGLNGAGKTTMIKLLLRLYDPTEGYITLNGTDIREYSRDEYYNLFSPVFQDLQIFAMKMLENVSMLSEEETDREMVENCIRKAGLGEKLDSIAKGIDVDLLKVVADDGIDLSGGEKQKLALARALYKAAPVVVLDEPTSALDAIAEQKLYETFDEMIGEKSAVYISHRLASTQFCDRVVMFKDGEIIESGSHEELMKLGGEYANMFELQAQYYQEEEEAV